ncbi:MAG: phenylalanine--tRNA ligase subunit alpha [Candidatus Woesearchaeota archaeon]
MADVLKTLNPVERKLLSVLRGEFTVPTLVKMTGLQEVEVVRGAQWLSNKGLADIKESPEETVVLGKNGIEYSKKGLPEQRFLEVLTREMTIEEIGKKAELNNAELSVSLGILRRKNTITIRKDKALHVKRTPQGDKFINSKSLEGKFIQKQFPLQIAILSDEDKYALSELKKRQDIVKVETTKNRTIAPTAEGKKIQESLSTATEVIERLTPDMLRAGSWKNKEFRTYDVKINVPKVFAGKTQPYADFIHQAREKLALMGFIEMDGPTVELEFFNFDALYQPQNHPARTAMASYSVKGTGKLPDPALVQRVKTAHETGGKTGSTGWGGTWSPEVAARLIARAQDTAISPRYLSRKDMKVPGKYFSLVRCYRPDVIDATHGVEFNQLGGFIVGKGLSFRNLLGLLKEFAAEMTGATEFKFFPDYFPFTEPSVQISAKTDWGWMELCGAGVFRPEMLSGLGIKEPVIAWGFGIDRLAMLKLGVTDIRKLFDQDLTSLRNSKKVML